MIATRMSQEKIVEYLLKHPDIDVNARSDNGNTPFLYASAKPSVSILRLLLNGGANFFATNANQDNCLLCAAISGLEDVFEFLVEAYHNIRTSRLPSSQHRPWESNKANPKKFFSHRNSEQLTVLMCAVMGGSKKIVDRTILEVRREFGINIPVPSPSALDTFFPSILSWALQPQNWKPSSKLFDPAPPMFVAYVDAQNVMGDTALHIAAENQAVDMYIHLLETTGADPMKYNRRGKRSFELFHNQSTSTSSSGGATIEEVSDDTQASTESEPTKNDSSSSSVGTSERASKVVEAIIAFQQKARNLFIENEARESEKRFSELMDEEESSKKKASKAPQAGKAEKAKKKRKSAAPTNNAAAATVAASNEDSANDSEEESISSDVVAPLSSNGSSVRAASSSPATSGAASSSATTSPLVLSATATPFIPLAELAAMDAANGWETVSSKPAKKSAASTNAPSSSSNATASTSQAKSKKKTDQSRKPKGSQSKPESKSSDKGSLKESNASKASESSKPIVPTTTRAWVPVTSSATPTTTAASPAAPVASQTVSAASTAPADAPTSVAASLPSLSLSDSSSTSDATLAAAQTPSAQSTSSSTLADLNGLFSSLHPHIESTDLQLHHFLGSQWSKLSLSQLGTLEEVYTTLSRQIRDAQFALFQQQQQELASELVRTKSEVSAIRKLIITNNAKADTNADKSTSA